MALSGRIPAKLCVNLLSRAEQDSDQTTQYILACTEFIQYTSYVIAQKYDSMWEKPHQSTYLGDFTIGIRGQHFTYTYFLMFGVACVWNEL